MIALHAVSIQNFSLFLANYRMNKTKVGSTAKTEFITVHLNTLFFLSFSHWIFKPYVLSGGSPDVGKPRKTLVFSATSDISADSIKRPVPGPVVRRCNQPGPWSFSELVSCECSQQDAPRWSFLGYSGHVVEPSQLWLLYS